MKREYFSVGTRRGLLLAAMTLSALTFAGCQEQEETPITENTVAVTREGALVSYMVDTFDKDYYDPQELAAMAMQEAETFSAKHELADGAEMVVQGVEVLPDTGQVSLTIAFANAESYAAYFGTETFYGTVNEAMAAGWSLSGKLMDTKKGEALSDEKLSKYGEKMIIISSNEVDIRVPGKIIAEGEDAGLKYIMMK